MDESHSEHNPVPASGDGGLIKAERLAPLEERTRPQSAQKQSDKGVINVEDTGDLKLPSQLATEEKAGVFGLEPITIIIMILSLAFIAFITYLISTEAPKPAGEPAPAAIEREP